MKQTEGKGKKYDADDRKRFSLLLAEQKLQFMMKSAFSKQFIFIPEISFLVNRDKNEIEENHTSILLSIV